MVRLLLRIQSIATKSIFPHPEKGLRGMIRMFFSDGLAQFLHPDGRMHRLKKVLMGTFFDLGFWRILGREERAFFFWRSRPMVSGVSYLLGSGGVRTSLRRSGFSAGAFAYL